MGFSGSALKRSVTWGKNSRATAAINMKEFMFRCLGSRKDTGTFPDASLGEHWKSLKFSLAPKSPRNTSVWGETESASSLLFPQPHFLTTELFHSLAYKVLCGQRADVSIVISSRPTPESTLSEHLLNWTDVSRVLGKQQGITLWPQRPMKHMQADWTLSWEGRGLGPHVGAKGRETHQHPIN